uniref:Uncharacterized protein n=1 Tax=Caenorhabditis japonica TaxID=281687 RepID=A0A8R1ITG3_CAEJA
MRMSLTNVAIAVRRVVEYRRLPNDISAALPRFPRFSIRPIACFPSIITCNKAASQVAKKAHVSHKIVVQQIARLSPTNRQQAIRLILASAPPLNCSISARELCLWARVIPRLCSFPSGLTPPVCCLRPIRVSPVSRP